MPCNDYMPPPNWQAAADKSEKDAVTLLCEVCSAAPITHLTDKALAWYFDHRKVDLAVAEGEPNYRGKGTQAEIIAIREQLRRLEVEILQRLVAASGPAHESTEAW